MILPQTKSEVKSDPIANILDSFADAQRQQADFYAARSREAPSASKGSADAIRLGRVQGVIMYLLKFEPEHLDDYAERALRNLLAFIERDDAGVLAFFKGGCDERIA